METTNNNKEMLTLNEVCELTNLSSSTVRLWIKKGQLPCYRFGVKLLRFKKEDVLQLMQPK